MDDIQLPELQIGRRALRSFKVDRDHLWPIAMSVDSWKDGTCLARCEKGSPKTTSVTYSNGLWTHQEETEQFPERHAAPHLGCDCGVYGTLSLQHLVDQYPSYAQRIVCVFAAEGPTLLGSRGMRTSAARILAYWAGDDEVREIAAGQFNEAVHYKKLIKMLDHYELPVLKVREENDFGSA